VTAAWPFAARAQQPERMRRIAMLMAYAGMEKDRQRFAKELTALKPDLMVRRNGPYHIVVEMPRCASQQNWEPMSQMGHGQTNSPRAKGSAAHQ
jgi:hypothetical protein